MTTKRRHIVFLFEGVPHYFSVILDGIQSKFDVTVIQAKQADYKKEGIKASDEGRYQRVFLEKKKNILGKDFFENFFETLEDLNPDVLVVNWPHWLQFVLRPRLYFKLKRNNIKLVLKEIPFCVPKLNESYPQFKERSPRTVHHLPVFKSRFRFLFQKISRYAFYRMVNGVLNYTDSKELYRSYGVKNIPIFTTYNSHNSQANISTTKTLKPVERNSFELVHVGRLVWWKRVDLLIDAANILVKKIPDLKVNIIGDGPEFGKLKEQVNRLGLEKWIIFHGSIYDPVDMAKILLRSSVYVLAGMGGLSINEAMAHGLPVICSVCDGTEKDLVIDGVNGLFFEDDNALDLSQKILSILDDEGKISRFGQASLEVVQSKINEQIVSDNYINAFNKILNPK